MWLNINGGKKQPVNTKYNSIHWTLEFYVLLKNDFGALPKLFFLTNANNYKQHLWMNDK